MGEEHGLNLFDAWNLHSLTSGPSRFLRSDFTEQFHQLLLAPRDLVFRACICGCARRSPDFVQPAIEDVEFLANFPDALQTRGFVDAGVPDGLEVLFQEIDQCSRL